MPQPMEWGRTLQKNKLCSYLISAAERRTYCFNLPQPSWVPRNSGTSQGWDLQSCVSSYLIIFFSPTEQTIPNGGKKGWKALACGKKIDYRKGNFMIKTPWKIVASKTDHCFSGGSKNFNFPLAIAPIISHSLISTCSPHIAPGFLAQEGNKVLETWVSFSDKLFLARQKSPNPSITVDFSF